MDRKYKILGVDLGGTNIRAGMVEGEKISELQVASTPSEEPQEVVLEALSEVISRFNLSGVEAIGIGVPSVVDVEKGIVYNVTNIKSWIAVPLKSWLEKRFGVPVFVNNDANCFAAGEKYFGKAKDVADVAAVAIGTGVGTGLIVRDKLYEGRNCGAGEIANLPYLAHNYEYYCSGQFFKDEHRTSGKKLVEDASGGDPEALGIFNDFGWHFGKFLQAVLYAYDPAMVVLGGSVSKSYDLFKDSMYRSLHDGFIFPGSLDNLRIELSVIDHISVYGAASLFYDKMKQ